MKRGDICLVAAPGDYGKPRPAVIIQTDTLIPDHYSVIVSLMTAHISDAAAFRVTVSPTAANGLKAPSQIMVDKIVTLPRRRIGQRIGALEPELIVELNRRLAFVVRLGDPVKA